MPERTTSESWSEYRRLVLAALERFEQDIEDLKKNSGKIENLEKAVLQLKQTIYGPFEDESNSIKNRVIALEHYVNQNPTLKKPILGPEDQGPEKLNAKMLVLLVGAISGLVALATTMFEFVMNLINKT